MRFGALAFLLCAAAVGALHIPFRHWQGESGVHALWLAAGIAVVAAWIAHAVGAFARTKLPDPDGAAPAMMVGLTARMLITLFAALGVIVAAPVPAAPFGIALSVCYLLLLALEVFVTLGTLRQNPPPSGEGVVGQETLSTLDSKALPSHTRDEGADAGGSHT